LNPVKTISAPGSSMSAISANRSARGAGPSFFAVAASLAGEPASIAMPSATGAC
jgi:hypothetical protein